MTDPSKAPIIVLAGPTASGKSALGIAIAEKVQGTIINADSMQVYRDLRVLTARPTDDEMLRVPHRLYGVLDRRLGESEYLADDYSIADMAVWPWVRGYKSLGIDLGSDFPNLQRWFKLVGARPAVLKGANIGKDDFARRQKELRGN